MKKRFIIIIVLTGLIMIGSYIVLDGIFPKANAINCPEGEDVISISIAQNNDAFVEIGAKMNEELLQNIVNADPTRKMSVNDYPAVNLYYAIEIKTLERSYRYFIYSEDSQVYIEIPYEGVYRANQQLLDLVEDALY